MKTQLTAVLDAMLRPRAARVGDAEPRDAGPSIAQIIAALDDRDTRDALELLDAPASATAPARRMKCAGGCGE
jgi:hypothetical protein